MADIFGKTIDELIASLGGGAIGRNRLADILAAKVDSKESIPAAKIEAPNGQFANGVASLVGDFDVQNLRFTNPADNTQILKQDPTRIAWICSISMASAYQLSPVPFVGTAGGIHINATVGIFQCLWRDFGAMVTFPWVIRGAAAANVSVLDVTWRPNRG